MSKGESGDDFGTCVTETRVPSGETFGSDSSSSLFAATAVAAVSGGTAGVEGVLRTSMSPSSEPITIICLFGVYSGKTSVLLPSKSSSCPLPSELITHMSRSPYAGNGDHWFQAMRLPFGEIAGDQSRRLSCVS